MNAKKFLLPSLLAGTALTLFLQVLAKSTARRPRASFARSVASDLYERYAPETPSFADIDACIEAHMQRLHIPGASLAIIDGDQVVHQKGFGQARPGGEIPTPLTPFFIGSLTKSITALAIMQLVEAGKIALDAPLQRYLPWFRLADPVASSQLTLRHLLNQTSGISSSAGEVIMADVDDRPGATERQARSLSGLKLIHPVGEKVEYSNLNYNLLGLVIEVASAETYSDYIQKHVFTPLGMHHSYTFKAAARANGLAMGHRHWFGFPWPAPNLPIPMGSLPAGQLISCTEDMARYLVAHLNAGRSEGVQILSSAGIDELHRGVKEYLPFGISSGLYAMGWFDQLIGQTRVLSHGGNVPDFSAFMSLIPGQTKGLVVLFNADPYGMPPITEEIGLSATALLAGQQPSPVRLDFIQWIFRLLPLIPLLQVAGVIATRRMLIRWRREPPPRPTPASLLVRHILLPLIPNLSLAAILAYLHSSRLLGFLDLFMPDLARIARLSGGFAAIWTIVRTRLVLRTLHKPRL